MLAYIAGLLLSLTLGVSLSSSTVPLELVLVLFLFLTGVDLTIRPQSFRQQQRALVHGLVLVLITVIGTALGMTIGSYLFPDLTFLDTLLIGSGFAYASATSVIVQSTVGGSLATLAFLTNVIRELLTLLFATQISRLGIYPLIAASASTSMDSALPLILRNGGSRAAVPSITHGFILTALVPILVTALANVVA